MKIPSGVHYVTRFAWQPKPWPKGYTTTGWYYEGPDGLVGPFATCEIAAAEQLARGAPVTSGH